jgi:anthranilate phosphoribosyltransferase
MSAPSQEHPFAPYIRILGKGKTGTRSLDETEAQAAFAMILRDEVEPLQLGAFLMLLRVKEETPAELAGFARACRETMAQPPAGLHVDLDWSSYAGKRHQHPWYLLSAWLLADAGYRVLMHGSAGHTPGRLYSEHALQALGIAPATGWSDAREQLDATGFSYLPLAAFCPALDALMQLKPLLGLRSPVNTLARILNPLDAAASIQSVFHPAYAALHQQAGALLGHDNSAAFKGESGEVEVKPQADTQVYWRSAGSDSTETLTRNIGDRPARVEAPAVEPVRALWRGEDEDAYGREAVLGTAAVALRLLQPELDAATARARADALWADRRRESL